MAPSRSQKLNTTSSAGQAGDKASRAPVGSRVFETVHLPRNRTMKVLREDVHQNALAAARKVMEKYRD